MIFPVVWKHRSIIAGLLVHALLFLWMFAIEFSPEEKTEIENGLAEGRSLLEYPLSIVKKKGPHWLPAIPWGCCRGDVEYYWNIGNLCLKGDVGCWKAGDLSALGGVRSLPYRDIPLEYQPIGVLSLLVPALVSSNLEEYTFRFGAWLGLLHLINLLLALHLFSDGTTKSAQWARTLWWSATFLVCIGNIAAARFDPFVATTMLLAALVFVRAARPGCRRPLICFAAFGAMVTLGVLTKVVPVLMLPAGILVLGLRSGERFRSREIGAMLCGFAGTFLVLSALFHLLFGKGYWASFGYHMERPIQIESFYAGILMLAHLAGMDLGVEYTYSSANLVTPLTATVQAIAPLLMCGLILLIAVRTLLMAKRGDIPFSSHGSQIGFLTLTLLLSSLLANKVFSPQYLLWVAPFLIAAAAIRGDMKLPGRIFLMAALVTQVIFPNAYDLLLDFQLGPVLLLNLRNLILIALLFLLLRGLPRFLAGGCAGD